MKTKVLKNIKIIIVNVITLTRFFGALSLPFIYCFKEADIFALYTIFLFLTDCIDGNLARAWKVSTFFGSALDALSDKLLNSISFILLSIKFSSMLLPLILEIAIFYTIYSTYRYGGNLQASIIGKIKTVILDVFVIASFCLLSLPIFKSNSNIIIYLITNCEKYINLFSSIISIFCIVVLLDYIKKNKLARENPKADEIKSQKKKPKKFNRILKEAFDTNYYNKHRNESIMKQLFV